MPTASSTEPATSNRLRAPALGLGHAHQRHEEGDEAQRRLDEEDHPPADGLDQRPADHHAQHRRAGRHQAEVAERLDPLLGLEHAVDDRHGRRRGGRAERRRQRPEDDERRPRSTRTPVAMAKMPAPASPTRKTFLWPHRSPALPKAGPTTPKASIGPVITHDSVVSSEPMSSAMSTSDTASSVIVTLTVNRPTRATTSTDHGLVAGPARAEAPDPLADPQEERPRDDGDLVDTGRLDGQLGQRPVGMMLVTLGIVRA